MKVFTWRQRWIVYSTNAMIIPVCAFGGYLVDSWLGTRPWGLVIGTVASFPFALAATLFRIRRDLKHKYPSVS